MRERIRSRVCTYPQQDYRWAIFFFLALCMVCAAWSAAAQPGETTDVPGDQVKKITIEGEGSIEVLDVEDVGDVAVEDQDNTPQAPEAGDLQPPVITDTPGTPVAPEPAPGDENLSWDQRVTRDLTYMLRQDPQIGADAVTVDSSEGTIRLTGTVTTLGAKNRAGQLARRMRGVQQIENELTVAPSDLDDATVQSYVQSALGQEPGIDRDAITVEVANGEVTLSGTVGSWQEKELVEDVASETRGVVAVDNELAVEIARAVTGSDEDVTQQVRQRLTADPWIAAENVAVSVEGGEVRLSGMVHSIAQRDRAMADAWVRGARSVNIDDLRIVPLAEGETPQTQTAQPPQTTLTPMTNEEVESAVLSSLSYSPRLRGFEPRVKVDNGMVVLEGTARTVRERNIAEQLAKQVRGVYSIENNIEVSSTEELTDTELADKVRDAIDQHPDLSRLDVAVTVMEGVAYLSGTLTSPVLQRDVQNLAATVPGVTKIMNQTKLAETVARKDDFQLKQDIETALYWSPYVDLDDINVTVTNGVARLDGTVQRWASRLAAEDTAQQVGAIQVENNLRVLEGPIEMQAQGQQQLTIPLNESDEVIIRK